MTSPQTITRRGVVGDARGCAGNDSATASRHAPPLQSRRRRKRRHQFTFNPIDTRACLEMDILLQIENQSVSGMVDTGARRLSCISQDLARKVCRVLSPPRTTASLGDGTSPLKITGEVDLNFIIDGAPFSHRFLVCKSLSFPIILGSDFLKVTKAAIDYEHMSVTFRRCASGAIRLRVPCCNPSPAIDTSLNIFQIDVPAIYSGDTRVISTNRIKIPAHTAARVDIRCEPYPIDTEEVALGSLSLHAQRELTVPDLLISPDTRCIQVFNNSPVPCYLPRHTTLATLASNHHHVDITNPSLNSIELESTADISVHRVEDGPEETTAPETGPPKFDLNPKLPRDQFERFRNVLHRNQDVFVTDMSQLQPSKLKPAYFEVKPEARVNDRPYRMSPKERSCAEAEIQKLKAAGLITKSFSPHNSRILMIKKADRKSYRVCLDFRSANKAIVNLHYALPKISDCLDRMGGHTYFSSCDLASGYFNVPLHESCRGITAFETDNEKWEWTVLPQGLAVSPPIFADRMSEIFQQLRLEQVLTQYFDDCVIHTNNFGKHLVALEKFFQILRECKVFLNAKKCSFGYEEIEFLGVVVNGTHMKISPKRVEAVRKMNPPRSGVELRSQIGFWSYNRKFIPNFAKKARCLQDLLKTDTFQWLPEHEQCRQQLIADLLSCPPLLIFDNTRETILTVDACGYGLGTALYQRYRGSLHPVAFHSRSLNKHEQRYFAHDLESLGLSWAFMINRTYLLGVHCTVITDHQSLVALMKTKEPTGRKAKHILYLSNFSFTIKYRKGKSHLDADGLSRSPLAAPDDMSVEQLLDQHITTGPAAERSLHVTTRGAARRQRTAQQQAAIPANQPGAQDDTAPSTAPSTAASTARQAAGPEPRGPTDAAPPVQPADGDQRLLDSPRNIRDIVIQQQKSDPTLQRIIHSPTREAERYELQDGLLYYKRGDKRLLAVPETLQKYILQQFHDGGGHYAQDKTAQKILNSYYWPSVLKDCSTFAQSCDRCQRTKSNRRIKPGLLKPVQSKHPFRTLVCDFIGELPKSNISNNKFIFVITCAYSKYLATFAVPNTSTKTVLKCFNSFFFRYGWPTKIILDRQTSFTSEELGKFMEKWRVDRRIISTATHHVLGNAENRVQNQKQILSAYVEKDSHWEQHLELATFAYNTTPSSAHGFSPHYVVHAYKPLFPLDVLLSDDNDQQVKLSDKLKTHLQVYVDTLTRLRHTQQQRKAWHDRGRTPVYYHKGQRVMVYSSQPLFNGVARKVHRWVGPFTVIRKLNRLSYCIRLRKYGKLRPDKIHVRFMKPYISRPMKFRFK